MNYRNLFRGFVGWADRADAGLARSQMPAHDARQVQEAMRRGVGLVLEEACNWEMDGRGGWCQPVGGGAGLLCA